ncbi:endonuclease domain-containing protein [Fodinibius salicampi]|uniref:endonuclease domain-containing protein n=1 Tax=Fodinibius salicampi TaxID=1920655 RepID=UPI0031F15C9B
MDFYCKELRLAIEIDGKYHDHQQKYDLSRQRKLESLGVQFLRFSKKEVLNEIDNILRVIEQWVSRHID